ncbi:MAG: TlyA family rRNA (cytidine-2'-O)-methyltransferase, partial [Carnobacterium sp.]
NRNDVGEKGIIYDPNVHQEVLKKMIQFSLDQGYDIEALSFSPITGGQGNIEFLAHLKWNNKLNGLLNEQIDIDKTVEMAHMSFQSKQN